MVSRQRAETKTNTILIASHVQRASRHSKTTIIPDIQKEL